MIYVYFLCSNYWFDCALVSLNLGLIYLTSTGPRELIRTAKSGPIITVGSLISYHITYCLLFMQYVTYQCIQPISRYFSYIITTVTFFFSEFTIFCRLYNVLFFDLEFYIAQLIGIYFHIRFFRIYLLCSLII